MRKIILAATIAVAGSMAMAQSTQGGPSPDGYAVQGGKVMMTKSGNSRVKQT